MLSDESRHCRYRSFYVFSLLIAGATYMAAASGAVSHERETSLDHRRMYPAVAQIEHRWKTLLFFARFILTTLLSSRPRYSVDNPDRTHSYSSSKWPTACKPSSLPNMRRPPREIQTFEIVLVCMWRNQNPTNSPCGAEDKLGVLPIFLRRICSFPCQPSGVAYAHNSSAAAHSAFRGLSNVEG